MKLKSHLVYFSPTSTTRRIVEQIAAGLKTDAVEICDLTHRPDVINACLSDGIAIIGVPVYAGLCRPGAGGLPATAAGPVCR